MLCYLPNAAFSWPQGNECVCCAVAEANQPFDGLVDANREFAINFFNVGKFTGVWGTEVLIRAKVTDLFTTTLLLLYYFTFLLYFAAVVLC